MASACLALQPLCHLSDVTALVVTINLDKVQTQGSCAVRASGVSRVSCVAKKVAFLRSFFLCRIPY